MAEIDEKLLKVEGLLTDFAGEYAEPYAYMTNDKPPAVQTAAARRKVVAKYAAKLYTESDVAAKVAETRKVVAGEILAHADKFAPKDGNPAQRLMRRHLMIAVQVASGEPDIKAIAAQLTKPNPDAISPCGACYCQTKTIDGKCGKCGAAKPKQEDTTNE